MGHRHGFTPSHVFEIENDQSWNHVHQERSYNQLGSENGSVVYPVQNVHVDGVNYGSYWNPVPRSNGFASSSQMNEIPHYQHVSERSMDSYVPLHGAVTNNLAPNNYTHNASSSSNHGGHTISGADVGGSIDMSTTNNRGPYKRKSPANPPIYEGSSTSRYYSSGSSSNVYGLTIGDEGAMRNVRSRSTVDLGTNLDRNLPTNPQHHSFLTNYVSDQSTSVEHFGQGSNASMQELNNQGRIIISDNNISSQNNNHFIVGTSTQSAAADSVGYHNDFASSRPPIPHNITSQPVRGARSSYDQRSAPAFRASSSSNLRLGYTDNGNEGLQLVAGNHSSRHHSRGFSSTGWRNNERSGRSRISSERYRFFHHDHMSLHEQFAHEGLVVVDRSGYYGSRNLNDQHRDLRLDIENMSYEELLALGERIGHVNTGLSENMITKSLTVSVYCLSDQCEEESKCVICLEEYKNMDEVATMKACKHDFHVNCIKKWLSMKNMCPICKTTSMADHLKKEQ